MSAEELKNKGNVAYKAGEYMEAIECYTQAIQLEPTNYTYYSNRSAAYLKEGRPYKALEDANKSLELSEGKFLKAYSRGGAALHALKRYNESIDTYQEGLEKFPNDPILTKQLEDVKKEKSLKLSSKMDSIKRTSVVTNKKAKEASNMSEFVTYAKSNLQLQILELQSQMKLIETLGEMSDKEKLQLLFQLLDSDKDGYIDAKELSDGIRKRNEGMSFEDGLERAIKMVALFDKDDNQKLSLEEFETFVKTMLTELGGGITFHELSEFLILQLLFNTGNDMGEIIATNLMDDEINSAVKDQSDFYKVLMDDRMLALFHLFDIDGDGSIEFKEVALGLFKLSNDMESSSKAAIELLILCDKDETRTLDYEQFARLILNVTAAGGVEFNDVADSLTVAMAKSPTTINENELEQLIIADELYETAANIKDDIKEEVQVMNALSKGKLHKLFDLWDMNHDNYIDYEELVLGMRKYAHEAMSIEESVQEAAITMLAFDQTENQKLNKEEFALAIVKFSEGVDTDLDELIDFMCVASVLKENTPEEKAYIKAISSQATRDVKLLQDVMNGDAAVIHIENIE